MINRGRMMISACQNAMAETIPFFTHLLVGFQLQPLDITRDFYGCLDSLQLKENLNDVPFITHDGLAHTCVKFCLDGCVVKVYDKLACKMTSHSQVDCFWDASDIVCSAQGKTGRTIWTER